MRPVRRRVEGLDERGVLVLDLREACRPLEVRVGDPPLDLD